MGRMKKFCNHNILKQLLAWGILGVMCFSLGKNVMATNYSNECRVPISTYREDNLDIEPVQNLLVPRQYSGLESSYVSPYVTSIKDQNPYGSCWTFATMAASEASMIKEGLGTRDALDLSEWQLAYFTAHSVTDPLGGTAGDCFALRDEDYLNSGGNQQIATYRIANWYGVVDEKTAPYSTLTQYDDTQIQQALLHTLPDSAAYSQDVAHLENAYWISMSDSLLVKQMIKQYGACGASYYSADAYYSTGSASTWRADEEVAVYCPTAAEEGYANTNHAITIVGWDDNYAKENFNSNAQPSSDGAWYCKNSWGSNWSKDGYFWISYEDVRLKEETAFFFDYGTTDNYDNNYQYDGGAWGCYIDGYDAIANIYTAKQNEYVKAVGFYTDNSNYNCKVYIYKNVDKDDPYSGSLVLEQTANQLYAGFHTVKLTNPIEMKEGESYSVVIQQEAADGAETRFTLDSTITTSSWFTNTVSVEAGQSFIGYHGRYMWDAGVEYDANCRIKSYTDNKVLVDSIELNKTDITLYNEDTITLSATIAPENADEKTVVWTSSDNDVATVDENGVVTGVKAGMATITCTAQDGSNAMASCNVVVKQWVTSVALNYDDVDLVMGDTLKLKATVLPMDATDKTLTWSSSDEDVATVDEDGVIKAKSYGETTIICTAVDQNQVYGVCKVQVLEPIESITLNENAVIMNAEDTLQLNATITPDVGRTKGIYWSSSDETVATVNGDGLVTPVSSGEVIIRCIAKDGTNIVASCKVTVKKKVTDVDLYYTEYTLLKNQMLNLEAKILPEDATDKTVKWMSTNEDVATISDTGDVMAVGYGETTIICTSNDNNQYSATCTIKVLEWISEITLDETTFDMEEGDTVLLNETVSPDVTRTKGVYWISSNEQVAVVSDDGMVTAVSGGTSTISCIAKDGSGVIAKCDVTVKQWVSSVKLNYVTKEMMRGDRIQLVGTVAPVTATNKSVSWKSSDDSVATVTPNGLVNAIGYGQATVTCTAQDGSQCNASCKITVYEPIISIVLNMSAATMKTGDALQLRETVTPTVTKTKGVYWISTNSKVASVDETGRLKACSVGQAMIQCIAKDGTGVKGTCLVTVLSPKIIRDTGEVFQDTTTHAEYKVTKGGSVGATVQFAKGTQCEGNVTIPDTIAIDGVTYKVTSIASNAFKGNAKIKHVEIKDNITSIGKNAFSGCKNLTSVTIGKNVKTVSACAFYNCKSLKTITLGNAVKTIGDKAFYKCSKLKRIVIPSKVSKIGKQAFYKCKALKTVTIKTSKLTKKKVGKQSFQGIHAKATIKVPKKKFSSYRSILKSRGIGKKVKIKKS